MGRESTPLTTRCLEPLENRVEVLIAESRLAHCATNNPDDVEEEQLMTVLVSFDPTPAQRWAARALAGTYITAQCQFEQLPCKRGLDDWLGDLLKAREPASLCIVLSLPEHSADLDREISRLLSDLGETQRHHLHLTVAVSQNPVEWNACTGIEGFVSADVKARGSASLQVFNMLAALIAPGMSVCVDAEDLRPVFGTAEQPSLIVNGVWLPGLEVFEVVTHEDRQLLKASSRVAYMPSTPLTISSQTKLLKAIRKSASDDTELVMMGPYGMLAESIQADRVVSVQLIAVSIPLAGSTPGISQTSKVIG